MTKGVSPIFSSLINHMSWFGTPVALLFLMGEVDLRKYEKKVIWKYLLIAVFVVIILVSVFYGVFKDTAGMHSFAITDLSQVSNESTAIDEISWFANQPQWYRYQFMSDVTKQVKGMDNNGHVALPGRRTTYILSIDKQDYYVMNNSEYYKNGFSDEQGIIGAWK